MSGFYVNKKFYPRGKYCDGCPIGEEDHCTAFRQARKLVLVKEPNFYDYERNKKCLEAEEAFK